MEWELANWLWIDHREIPKLPNTQALINFSHYKEQSQGPQGDHTRTTADTASVNQKQIQEDECGLATVATW